MGDQVLAFIVCILPLIILTVFAAAIGSNYRAKLANRIMSGKREGRFKDLSNPKSVRKLRWISLLALFSIIGIFSVLILTMNWILPIFSKLTIGLYILFTLGVIVFGWLLIKEVVNRLR